jgi:hypothetical protein
VNLGAHAIYYENSKKSYFKVLEKIENMETCKSYVDIYLCRFWHKNDHV